jgi:hypothetical protein
MANKGFYRPVLQELGKVLDYDSGFGLPKLIGGLGEG